ncbi:peptigoglycan-binding protein LysM [Bacillus licheniformis]|uniref:Spore coat assembly protein SafA n=1 Tax=Bacillus cabrialesii subsp. tritici TaxID=2944916 RepID=A0ABT9DMW8_9BACI|nr:spore coat assembly protein SafA [Bacillus cabrialesii]MDO8226018.1 spore coat assembly protein SafA [Bacillus cabrialesii subsp. tritici]OLQ51632.1 peptigoglycan-binding protein LysM [Bacillus licheniformis]
MKIHIVQKGDSLLKIAEKYGVDIEEVKKLNTQLSNPDLIMPGMKIKVPSEGVPVRKEPKAGKSPAAGSVKQEHPFAKEKPNSVVDVEDTKPKEKMSVPYVPPMPNLQENVYPEADVNDYYDMKQLFQPWSPPKPEEPKKHHDGNMDQMYHMQDQFPQQEAMSNMENANYPNMPNMPKAPEVGGIEEENVHHTVPNMPAVQPYYHYPAHFMPCPVPVSPILPGSGLCYPYFPAHAYPMYQPYGYQPGFVSPQYDPGEYENQHHGHYGSYGAPQYASPAYGSPYGQMPYGPHYGSPQVMGAYQPAAPGFMPYKDHDDCGCDDDHHQPYYSAPGYSGLGAYGTPNMPYGGANPNPNPNPYAAGVSMPMGNQPSVNQMFGRPEEENE